VPGEAGAAIQCPEARVSELEQHLNQNSLNSHLPPSTEGCRKPRSLSRRAQEAAGRKPGGPEGREVRTVAMVKASDLHGRGAEKGRITRAKVPRLPTRMAELAAYYLERGSWPSDRSP